MFVCFFSRFSPCIGVIMTTELTPTANWLVCFKLTAYFEDPILNCSQLWKISCPDQRNANGSCSRDNFHQSITSLGTTKSVNSYFSRASTPDFSQISLGDTRWCDGLTREGDVSRGMVAALALADSSIQIVNWRDEKGENEW